ncbi:MAG: MAE_28990/MAE_18760 family HEPN-like nuclease [Bacteroidia bacterium]
MHSIKLDFQEKIEEAEVLLKHLEEVSFQKQSVQKVAILKSTYIFLLYNIVESTTKLVFERVHEDLYAYNYHQLSEKIQHLYVEFHFKNSTEKQHKKIIDATFSNQLNVPLLDEYKKKIKLFSGNLDARELDNLLKKYGIGVLTCKNKHRLHFIKIKRNKLAHGEEMLKESCRGFTAKELALYGKAVDDSISQLINLADTYLTNKIYLNN